MTLAGERILVVEDSDEDFDTVEEAARRTGLSLDVVRVADGDAAVERLSQKDAHSFRLVLLDNNLPGATSGYDVLVHLRSHPELRHLPAVMFTTSSNPRDCLACHRAGVNAYHIKDIQFHACLETLNHIFDYWLKRAVAPLNEGRAQ